MLWCEIQYEIYFISLITFITFQYTIILLNGKCCTYLFPSKNQNGMWHELSTYTKTNFPTGIKSQILTIYCTYNIATTTSDSICPTFSKLNLSLLPVVIIQRLISPSFLAPPFVINFFSYLMTVAKIS